MSASSQGPFSIALSFDLYVSDGSAPIDLTSPRWDDLVRFVASREAGSRRFPDNQQPSTAEVNEALGNALADHPMVSTSQRASGEEIEREQIPAEPTVIVMAKIVKRGEMAHIPPGGEYPILNPEDLTMPVLILIQPWGHEKGPDEVEAGEALLAEIGSHLSRDWIDNG